MFVFFLFVNIAIHVCLFILFLSLSLFFTCKKMLWFFGPQRLDAYASCLSCGLHFLFKLLYLAFLHIHLNFSNFFVFLFLFLSFSLLFNAYVHGIAKVIISKEEQEFL